MVSMLFTSPQQAALLTGSLLAQNPNSHTSKYLIYSQTKHIFSYLGPTCVAHPQNLTQCLLTIGKTNATVIKDPKLLPSFGALWSRDSPPCCWAAPRQMSPFSNFLFSPGSSLTLFPFWVVASCCCLRKISQKERLLSHTLSKHHLLQLVVCYSLLWSRLFPDQLWNPLIYHTLWKASKFPTSILWYI